MSPQKRCAPGSRKNRQSGKCESTTSRRKQTKSTKRCKNGFRKTRQGECQAHNRPSRKKTKTTSHRSAHRKTPSAHRKTPSVHRKTPSAHRKTPSVHRKTPSAHRKTPSVHHRSPSVHRRSPSVHHRSPSVHHRSPSARQTSPVRDFTQRMGMDVQNKKMCCRGSDESGRSREAALNTLCFDQDATPTGAAIKKNYRNCALQVHPDKNRNDPRAKEFFQHVNNANDKLLEELEETNE